MYSSLGAEWVSQRLKGALQPSTVILRWMSCLSLHAPGWQWEPADIELLWIVVRGGKVESCAWYSILLYSRSSSWLWMFPLTELTSVLPSHALPSTAHQYVCSLPSSSVILCSSSHLPIPPQISSRNGEVPAVLYRLYFNEEDRPQKTNLSDLTAQTLTSLLDLVVNNK